MAGIGGLGAAALGFQQSAPLHLQSLLSNAFLPYHYQPYSACEYCPHCKNLMAERLKTIAERISADRAIRRAKVGARIANHKVETLSMMEYV